MLPLVEEWCVRSAILDPGLLEGMCTSFVLRSRACAIRATTSIMISGLFDTSIRTPAVLPKGSTPKSVCGLEHI